MADDKNSRVPRDRISPPTMKREVPVDLVRSPVPRKESVPSVQRATGRVSSSSLASAVGSSIATATGGMSGGGADTAAGTGQTGGGEEVSAIGGGQLDDVTLEATGTVGWPHGSVSARSVTSSSTWTGRRSQQEQVAIVEKFAPMASEGVRELIFAVEQKRFNDPQTQEALAALKELHSALGELIQSAERGQISNEIWNRVEASKERFGKSVSNGARVMFAAPALSIGTAHILSYLSGFPVTCEMVTALCASSLLANALIKE